MKTIYLVKIIGIQMIEVRVSKDEYIALQCISGWYNRNSIGEPVPNSFQGPIISGRVCNQDDMNKLNDSSVCSKCGTKLEKDLFEEYYCPICVDKDKK